MPSDEQACRCGQPRKAHEHYTVPGDLRCGLCQCPRWSRTGLLAAARIRLPGRGRMRGSQPDAGTPQPGTGLPPVTMSGGITLPRPGAGSD